MKIKLFFILLFILALSGCITHVFVDGEVRLQIKNESDVSIARLVVLSANGGEDLWISDTIAPGATSRVISGSWVGSFDLGMSVEDSLGRTWSKVRFPSVSLDGGSVFAEISEKDGEWAFKIR